MKLSIAVAVFAFSMAAVAADRSPLETTDQARQRQSAENYDTYRRQDNQLLPPSYQQPLGSPSIQGVERPGYIYPAPVYQPQQQPSYGGDWRDRAKGR